VVDFHKRAFEALARCARPLSEYQAIHWLGIKNKLKNKLQVQLHRISFDKLALTGEFKHHHIWS
jgi:hypothetical protein